MSPSEWQLSDVRSLRDGVAALDSDYLERSASALGLSELLTKHGNDDATPEIDALYRAMVQARPPGGDRFRIASDMFDITRAMVIAGIRAEKPQITASELRQELFLRYYGDAFSPEQRKRSSRLSPTTGGARRRLRTRERGAVEVISATCRRTLRGWT